MGACERTPAEDDGSDRARGCRIVDTNKAASRFFVDGHFRHDGDAHAGSHHAEEAAELAALKYNLRVEAGTVARRDGGIAEAVAVAQKQKGLGAKVFERERPALGEFVAWRQRGEEALREQRKCFEFVAADGESEYR